MTLQSEVDNSPFGEFLVHPHPDSCRGRLLLGVLDESVGGLLAAARNGRKTIPGNRYADRQADDRSEAQFDGKKRLARELSRSPTSEPLAEVGEFAEARPELAIAQTHA